MKTVKLNKFVLFCNLERRSVFNRGCIYYFFNFTFFIKKFMGTFQQIKNVYNCQHFKVK